MKHLILFLQPMQFIFPGFLWALLLLAIPIIIHLFYFRRFKKVYFTNVKFLKEVKDETSNRSRLRNLLVLLSRLLALAALILAFAQPYLSDKKLDRQEENYISLFVDNSFSMRSLSEDVPLFDKAKSTARQIIETYGETDHFQVITHQMNGAQQRWLNRDDALLQIDEIEITPEVNQIESILNRQISLLDLEEGNKNIYLLSDFQQNISNLPTDIDTSIFIKLMPFQSIQENNISIDSVWTVSPVAIKGQTNRLVVELTNYGNEDKEEVRLFVKENGQTKPVGNFDIAANSSVSDTIELVFIKDGYQNIEVQIEDYPIQFDDSYLLTLDLNEKVDLLSINEGGGNKFVTALMKGLPNFNLDNQSSSNLQYNKFKEKDLIILNDMNNISSGLASELEKYVLAGGNLVVFPGRNSDITSYNQLFSKLACNSIESFSDESREVFKINTSDFIFSEVYERIDRNLKLPATTGNFLFSNFTSRGGQSLLNYRDGSSFLQKYQKGEGLIFVCAAPLSDSYNDLVKIAEVFVPMTYKMALSSGERKPIAYTIGADNLASVNNMTQGNEAIFKITGPSEFIPGQTRMGSKTVIDFNDMIQEAGYYDLSINDTILDRYAFNYDRTESKLNFLSIPELKEKYEGQYEIFDNFLTADIGSLIKQNDKGKALWRTFLILALVFLAIETLLLRFWQV